VRPVKLEEKCIAKAYVRSITKGKAKVEVFTYVGDEIVFQGNFIIYHSTKDRSEGGEPGADSD
jgi:hypothetical protein